MTLDVPFQWPPEVSSTYEPLGVLGKGGFASVVLGQNRETGERVALKVVGSSEYGPQEYGYAHREIDILRELDHPNIMKLLQYWELPPDSNKCAAVLALSYAKGPTLEKLLQKGGAVSLSFARVVGAQLVDVVAYMHSHAVMHRDIKPDNLVIVGAALTQEEIWDSREKEPDWNQLQRKWSMILVDFGFARALGPDDMKKVPPASKRIKNFDSSVHSFSDHSTHSLTQSGRRRSSILNRSMSRAFTRQMSAVGNRLYAAPEVTKNVKHIQPDVNVTLSEYVSYYGMMADAFSVGNTIKYMLTGAPPHENVNDLIALENSPIALLCACLSKSTEKHRYRRMSEIPPEVVRLIRGMTHYDPGQRTSTRTARRYPWVDDILETEPPSTQQVEYLSFMVDQKLSDSLTDFDEGLSPEELDVVNQSLVK